MNQKPFAVKIPVAALSPAMPECIAVIVNATGNDSLTDSLNSLYPLSDYRVYITEPGVNQLEATIAHCNEIGLKTIVLCGQTLPDLSNLLASNGTGVSLISAGDTTDGFNLVEFISTSENISDFSHIGYQIYKYNPNLLRSLRDKFFEDMRLGALRNDITLSEPLIRSKQYVFADLKSVRISDYPANSDNSPNGLYAEELCQLARYIGMNQHLKSFLFFGFPSDAEQSSTTSQLVAEVLWHLVEGIAANISEDPSDKSTEEKFIKKIVSLGEDGQDIVFVTSISTARWWMEVPQIKEGINQYIPCSHQDYLTAFNGEIPMRWLFFFQKINPF